MIRVFVDWTECTIQYLTPPDSGELQKLVNYHMVTPHNAECDVRMHDCLFKIICLSFLNVQILLFRSIYLCYLRCLQRQLLHSTYFDVAQICYY